MSRIQNKLFASLVLLAATGPIFGCASAKSRWYDDDEYVVRGQDDAGSGTENNSWWKRATGQGAAANVPLAKKLPWIGTPPKSEQEARGYFQKGEEAFRQKKYKAASKHYAEAAQRLPNSPLQEDAMFMLGESYFYSDQYADAFETYERLLNRYKRSRHLDTAVAREFAIGQYWIQREMKEPSWRLLPNFTDHTRPGIDTQGRAMRAFEKVRLNHPTGPLADDSMMATAGWFFFEKRYSDADYFYTQVRREYPSSEHLYEASLLGIQSKIRAYKGPEYDGQKLVEAKELIEQTLKQFPEISPDDRQRLMTLYGQVNQGLAQRDFHMGSFYEDKGYHAAAGIYYDVVAKEFPQTQMAAKSRERVVSITGKPAEPPRRLTWISALFPDEREDHLKVETVSAGGEELWR